MSAGEIESVNFHPSPLPRYRGPYPLVQAILDDQTEWGATCHKLAAEFDTGDILAQRIFPMTPDECHESLDLKTQVAMSKLASDVALNFEPLWSAAYPQIDGHYVRLWSDVERTLDFTKTTLQLDRQLRAFGNLDCIAWFMGCGFTSSKRWFGRRRMHCHRERLCFHLLCAWL